MQWFFSKLILYVSNVNISFFYRFLFFLTRQDKEWRENSVAGFFYLSTGDGSIVYHMEASHRLLRCVSHTGIKFIFCLLSTFRGLLIDGITEIEGSILDYQPCSSVTRYSITSGLMRFFADISNIIDQY